MNSNSEIENYASEQESKDNADLLVLVNNKIADAIKTFMFLQSLCEGHNEMMQNYLRDQFEKDDLRYTHNVDFINLSAQLFGSLIKILRPELVDLTCRILDFLIETVQGPCKQNQVDLFDSKIIDYCKDLMSEFDRKKSNELKGFVTNEEMGSVDKTIKKSVKLLTSILEGNNNTEIVLYMYNNLDMKYLHYLLSDEFENYAQSIGIAKEKLEEMTVEEVSSHIKSSLFEGEIVEAFEVYNLIARLYEEESSREKSKLISNQKTKLTGVNLLAFQFFKYFSGQIQIIFKDKELYNIRLIIHPACMALDNSAKISTLRNLDRSTAKDKINDFMNTAPKLFELIDHSTYLKNLKFLCFSNLFNNQVLMVVNIMAFFIVCCINFIMFYFFKKTVYKGTSINRKNIDSNHISINILNITHIILVSMQIIIWIIVKMPVVLKDGWRDVFSSYRRKLINKNIDLSEMDLKFRDRSLSDVSYTERIELLKNIHTLLGSKSSTPRLEYFVQSCRILMDNLTFLYSLMNLTMAIFVLIYKHTFFYGIMMLEIIVVTRII